MPSYGTELILDLVECQQAPFSRELLGTFLDRLISLIDMEAEDRHFWDYDDDPEGYEAAPAHLKGITVVQFIKTSNITIHSLDQLKSVYLNIFSCKDFDHDQATAFCVSFFQGRVLNQQSVERMML